MIKISDVVSEILYASPSAYDAMRSGFLNLSAYGKQIQPLVEERCWKPVKVGSIVAALARLAPKVADQQSLYPTVKLDDLTIKAALCDISFEKTEQTIELAHTLTQKLKGRQETFLTFTQSNTEITVIASQDLVTLILDHFSIKPKAVYQNIVGLTAHFSPDYLTEPNIIFSIISTLANKRVNLIEIVSTYTELTMLIEQKDLSVAINQLNLLFKK
jgi:hypothetical protein